MIPRLPLSPPRGQPSVRAQANASVTSGVLLSSPLASCRPGQGPTAGTSPVSVNTGRCRDLPSLVFLGQRSPEAGVQQSSWSRVTGPLPTVSSPHPTPGPRAAPRACVLQMRALRSGVLLRQARLCLLLPKRIALEELQPLGHFPKFLC